MNAINNFNSLPASVQRELTNKVEQQIEEQVNMRSSKFRHARTFMRLKKKYNFKVLRIGMN